MDRSYFNILDSIDPKFHSIVLTRIDEIRNLEGIDQVSLDDFNENDQMEVLGKYCTSMYDEFSALRTFILENMEVCSRSVRVRARTK